VKSLLLSPNAAAIANLRTELGGRVITPDDPTTTRHAPSSRRDRPPAGAHRQACGRCRRRARHRARARGRPGTRRAQRRPQRRRARRLRGGRRARPLGHAAAGHRCQRAHRVGRNRPDRGRVHGRGRGSRAGDGVRRYGLGRDRGITLGGVSDTRPQVRLTIDDLLAADIVTRTVNSSAGRETHADLFGPSAAAAAISASPPASSTGCTRSAAILGGMLMLPATPGAIASFMDARRPRPRNCRPLPTSCPRRRCRSCPRSSMAGSSSWR